MLLSGVPTKFQMPFGKNALGADIRTIPVTTSDTAAASQSAGFPPAIFAQVGAGGTPPDGRDFNGLFNMITAWVLWLQAGGPIQYDAAYQVAIGGYPQGSVIASDTTFGLYWISTVDSNTTNPDAGGAGWGPIYLPRKGNTYISKLTGSGTVTPSTNVARWRVLMVAGGGGGGFSAGGGTHNNGGNGVLTSLRDWTVNPGNGGGGSTNAGSGGSGGTNGTGTLIRRISGSSGQFGTTVNTTGSLSFSASVCGGGTPLGSGQGNSPANTGCGGRGDGTITNTDAMPGGGGGGELVEFFIDNPAPAGYAFSVGSGGSSSGSSQPGAAGAIYIEEIYP